MKAHIVGGGPAGLYFAILLKKLDRSHDVVVLDRGKPWEEKDTRGTLFADASFSYLADTDQAVHDAISERAQDPEHVRASYGGMQIAVRVGKMAAVSRKAILDVLRERARELGVDLRFDTEVGENLLDYQDGDLLVGADGAESRVRTAFEGHFLPAVEEGQTRYWRLGTTETFPEPSWILAERDGMRLLAHAWQYSRNRSSFVVECRDAAWRQSDLASLEDAEVASHLSEIFRDDLRGHDLSLEPGESWRQTAIVRNENWSHENVVLLGSAAAQAHFVFEHGFRRALEDASALANAFRVEQGVTEALELFESERKPEVDRQQRAAEGSGHWVEDLLAGADIDPVSLAYELATRTRKLTHGDLQRLDPPFVAEYEQRREASV